MIVVGNGRVGQALASRAESFGLPVTVVTRTHGLECLGDAQKGPVLVCINAGDIRGFASTVPRQRRPDLVFVQNGMIRPALVDVGCTDNTLGLLYFAVPTRGVPLQPGGTSLFCGPHAGVVVDWFRDMDLEADCVDRDAYTQEMVSKLIWNCTFGLLCDVHDQTVGALVQTKADAIEVLVAELCLVANTELKTHLDGKNIAKSVCEYSMTIPQYQGSLKQWEWRNGWFVEAARVHSLPTPVHFELLHRVGRDT